MVLPMQVLMTNLINSPHRAETSLGRRSAWINRGSLELQEALQAERMTLKISWHSYLPVTTTRPD